MSSRRNRDLFGPRRRSHLRSGFPMSRNSYAWAGLLSALLVLAATIRTGRLMQAAILDVISIWPLAALPIAVVVLRNRLANKRSPTRRKGPTFHIPLLLLIWMVVGVALHLVGWGRLPSSSAILNGPEAPDRLVSATLDIRTSGEVRLEGGGILLYEVTPLRSGGSAGPAQATESMDNGKATISLEESADAGWFGSHGWIVSVSESPQWDLTVRAPGLEADLTTTQLQSDRKSVV